MRKRDLLFAAAIMACFTGALVILIVLQVQASQRSEANIQTICSKLQRIDGQPCQLVKPSSAETRFFAWIRRAEGSPISFRSGVRMAGHQSAPWPSPMLASTTPVARPIEAWSQSTTVSRASARLSRPAIGRREGP